MGEVLDFALFVLAILGGVAFFGSYVIPKMERWAEEQEKLKSQKKTPTSKAGREEKEAHKVTSPRLDTDFI